MAIMPDIQRLIGNVSQLAFKTALADLVETLSRRFGIKNSGAAGDGVSDDMAAINRVAAATAVVRVEEPGSYFLAGVRPSLAGKVLHFTPGATLVVDENPNTKDMRLLSRVMVNNPVHGRTLDKPANEGQPYELVNAAAAAASVSLDKQFTALSFTSDFSACAITGTSKSAFTGAVAATGLSWASAFASGQEGAFRAINVGDYLEATFTQAGADDAQGFVSACVIFEVNGVFSRADFAVYAGSATYCRIVDSVAGPGIVTPNGGAYAISTGNSVTLGIRLVAGNRVEVYINGYRVETATLGGQVQEAGFLNSRRLSGNKVSIVNPMLVRGGLFHSPRPLKLAVIGDSISYGAWASLTYPDMLRAMAPGLPGIGALSIDNFGVSGSTTQAWVDGLLAQHSYAGYAAVLVMLGTNDTQGAVSPETFKANLATIANAIVSAGAVPIFGIFPVWTSKSVTNNGVTTASYANGAVYRSIVKQLAASNGYGLADVQDAFGICYLDWYGDNIHPQSAGHVVVAQAFAGEIARLFGPARTLGAGNWRLAALGNSWVQYDSNHYAPAFRANAGQVELRGSMKSGATAVAAFTLPVGYRPAKKHRFRVAAITSGAAIGTAEVTVSSNGDVIVTPGSDTALVCLDSVRFEAAP